MLSRISLSHHLHTGRYHAKSSSKLQSYYFPTLFSSFHQRLFSTSTSSSSPSSIFVSKHYQVDSNQLKDLLDNLETRYRKSTANDGGYELQVCNFCSKGNKTKESNMWKLKVNSDGSYHCYRCAIHGSWFDLKRKINSCGNDGDGTNDEQMLSTEGSEEMQKKNEVIPDQVIMNSHAQQIQIKTDPNAKLAVDYLTHTRKISKAIYLKYGVGVSTQKFLNDNDQWEELPCLSFPWMEVKKSQTEIVMKTNPQKSNNDNLEKALFDAAASLNSTSQDKIEENSPSPDSIPQEPVIVKTESVTSPQIFEIVRMKYRAISSKGKQRLFPKGGKWGFFGWHLVKPSHTEIIITEGEFDAMAIAQAISSVKKGQPFYKIPVISLPNGASSLPPDLLPRLENFKKIYLWMDNDEAGHSASEKFARKLGTKRCFIVKTLTNIENPPKDANDALRHETLNGETLILQMLAKAEKISHNNLSKFSDLRSEVINNILNGSKKGFSGTQTTSLPKLTEITKGFRDGELVIFTGPTGTGKTTLLSQLSLDFTKQGAPTLWGSFEIKNVQLLKHMLQQYHKEERLSTLDASKLEMISDNFEALPFLFMNFHGGSDLNEILDAMEFAVYQHDIKHIILDNLQFLMPRKQGKPYDKFEAQDIAIESFRRFASEKMVNLILVVHPRKEDDRVALNISSVFGTAKATQEADLVMILQRVEGGNYLEIRKNRYDGQLGKIPVDFNQMTRSFYESDREIDEGNSSNSSQSNSNANNNGRGKNKAKASPS